MAYNISLKEPGVVVNVPSYRIPYKYQAMLLKEQINLETSTIIARSLSTFNAPVLCVPKIDFDITAIIDIVD